MSNQPFSENLLSGYLDNQLSPELRAEVESQLAENTELKTQFEQLKRQSSQCASIPKYALDNGFADRVLSDPRAEAAFSAMRNRQAIAGGDVAYRPRVHPLRSAAIAILSLAALVLITLFLQNPESAHDAPVLSEREETPRKSDLDLGVQVDEPDVPVGNVQVFNGQVESDIAGIQQKSVGRVAPETMPNLDLTSRLKKAGGNERNDSLRTAGDQAADEAPRAMKQFGLSNDDEVAANQPIGNAQVNSLQDFIVIKLADGPDQLVDFHAALNRNQIVVNFPGQVESKLRIQSDSSNATNEKSDRSVAANEVQGVDNTGGGAGGGGLDLEAGIGGLGGRGRGGEVEPQNPEVLLRQQTGSRVPGDPVAPTTDSQLFLITATQKQMVGLIGELRNRAAISGYQLPESSLQPELQVPSLGFAQSVEPHMQLRGQASQPTNLGLSRESMNATRDKNLESSQQQDDQADVDALYLYFANQAADVKDGNSQTRQYLLFVNPQNEAMGMDQKSKSTIASPAPADPSELKK